jgi:hypothetical protein
MGSDRVLEDNGLGDLDRYTGFLKCLYTAGMVGGNAGYYAYPQGGFDASFDEKDPPHWLLQMIALSRVHALFSHLENDIRHGRLLPGPKMHIWSKDQPAYEFPTGDEDARVVIRRNREQATWLATAWAAGGETRDVTVTVPEAGEITLTARPDGGVYRLHLSNGRVSCREIIFHPQSTR